MKYLKYLIWLLLSTTVFAQPQGGTAGADARKFPMWDNDSLKWDMNTKAGFKDTLGISGILATEEPSFLIGQGADSTWDVVNAEAFVDTVSPYLDTLDASKVVFTGDSVGIRGNLDVGGKLDAEPNLGLLPAGGFEDYFALNTSFTLRNLDSLKWNNSRISIIGLRQNNRYEMLYQPDSLYRMNGIVTTMDWYNSDTVMVINGINQFLSRSGLVQSNVRIASDYYMYRSVINYQYGDLPAALLAGYNIYHFYGEGGYPSYFGGDVTVVGAINFATDTSTAAQPNIYDLVYAPFVSYTDTTVAAGTQISWIATTGNTDACNILLNALAQKDLFKQHNVELASGDIEVGQIVTAIYDGTQWQMTSQLAQ